MLYMMMMTSVPEVKPMFMSYSEHALIIWQFMAVIAW
jgi:hypothetical protein